MAEVVHEDRNVDIIQQWNTLNKDHQGFSLSYQLILSGIYVAHFQSNDGYRSTLYCPNNVNFTYYAADGHILLSAHPDIDGDIILNDICDLSDDGTRWEGTTKGSFPFGYGELYNPMNKLVYEGFMVQETKILWGKTFHEDLGTVEYEGGFCNNERMGYGTLMDRQGNCIYEGIWLNGNPITPNIVKLSRKETFTSLHNQVEQILLSNEVIIPPEKIFIVNFPLLKRFRVGSFHHVSITRDSDYGNGELYIIHCPCLEQVVFGVNTCVTIKKFVCRGYFEAVI